MAYPFSERCGGLGKKLSFPWPGLPKLSISSLIGKNRPAPARRSIFLEPLEPRLLMSADIAPIAGQGLIDGLDGLADWFDEISDFDEFDQPLPVVDKSLSELLDIGTYIRDTFVGTLEGLDFSTDDSAALRMALETALKALDAGNTVADLSDTEELQFDVAFHADDNLPLPFGLGDAAEKLGIKFDSTVDLSALVDFDFSFGFDLDPTLSPADAFFIDMSSGSFSVGGSIDQAVNFGFDLGFIHAQVVGGMLDMNAELDVTLPGLAGDSRASLSELTSSSLCVDNLVPSLNNSFSINLPVEATLDGFDGGIPDGVENTVLQSAGSTPVICSISPTSMSLWTTSKTFSRTSRT